MIIMILIDFFKNYKFMIKILDKIWLINIMIFYHIYIDFYNYYLKVNFNNFKIIYANLMMIINIILLKQLQFI